MKITGGTGVLLVAGEAFRWRPWGEDLKMVNEKGQWDVGEETFGLLGLVWPKPGMLPILELSSFIVWLCKVERGADVIRVIMCYVRSILLTTYDHRPPHPRPRQRNATYKSTDETAHQQPGDQG